MPDAKDVTEHFSGDLFKGEDLEVAVEKAKAIWNHVWEHGGNVEHVLFRNPYDPEERERSHTTPLYKADFLSEDMLLPSTNDREGFSALLDHVQEKGRIPYRDGTHWVYCVSGIIHFDTGEHVEVSLRSSSPLSYIGSIRPKFASAGKVKGWVRHYTPPEEGFEPVFNVQELVEQAKH